MVQFVGGRGMKFVCLQKMVVNSVEWDEHLIISGGVGRDIRYMYVVGILNVPVGPLTNAKTTSERLSFLEPLPSLPLFLLCR